MKRIIRVVSVCCIGMSCFGQAQTSQVHIAGNDYPVNFADTNLSSMVRQRIASDLTLIFSPATSFEESKRREVEEGKFRPHPEQAAFMLSRSSEGIFLIDQNNQQSIQVDKVASDLYLKSFALMKAQSNAVQKAKEFVTMLNATDLSALSAQELRGLIHAELWPKGEDNNSDEGIQIFFTMMQKYRCLDICALNFFWQRMPEDDSTKVLVAGVYMVDKADPPVESPTACPIEFYKGKWGFGRMPTELDDKEIMD